MLLLLLLLLAVVAAVVVVEVAMAVEVAAVAVLAVVDDATAFEGSQHTDSLLPSPFYVFMPPSSTPHSTYLPTHLHSNSTYAGHDALLLDGGNLLQLKKR